MADLKHWFDSKRYRSLAKLFKSAAPEFNDTGFCRDATNDLDTRELAMMAESNLAKAQFAKKCLSLFHLAEALDRHFRSVWQARGEASGSRQVRRWEPRAARQVANILL